MIIRRAFQFAGAVLLVLVTLSYRSVAAAPQAGFKTSTDSGAACSPSAVSAAIRPNSHLLSEDKYGPAPVLVYQGSDAHLLNEAKYGPAPVLSYQASDASLSTALSCAPRAGPASKSYRDDHLENPSKYGD